MTENLKNTESLLLVKDGKMKDSLEKLLKVSEQISGMEDKIIYQRDEMVKTKTMIEQYEEYYDTQKKALEHFCSEKERLNSEYEILIFEVNAFQNVEMSKNIDKSELQVVCDIDDEHNKYLTESINNICADILRKESPTVIKNQTLKKESLLKLKHTKNNRIKQRINRKYDSIDILNKIKKGNLTSLLKKVRNDDNKNKCASIDQTVHEKNPLVKKLIASNSKIKLKISTTPLIKLNSVDSNYIIHKILIEKGGMLLCGSRGLLCHYSQLNYTYYLGHDDYYVYNVYKYLNVIVSLGIDYILFHNLYDISNHKLIFSFSNKINSTCLYKSLIYGVLDDGVMFVVDLEKESIECHGSILSPLSKTMVVIESDNIINLVVGKNNGEIFRSNLREDSLQCIDIGKVDGKLKGIATDGNLLVCYTDHELYLINKENWELTLIREMANVICFVQMCLGKIVVIDNCNILHKYVIKKGRISTGSTIESLTITNKISALQVCAQAKKVFVASKSDIYSKKL